MMELFNDIHENLGITVILISHQMDIVLKYADEVKVIKAGEIVAEDKPVNIFTNKELLNQTHLNHLILLNFNKQLRLNII